MRPKIISRAIGALLLPGWFAASGASAASLQVAPILLEVISPGAATTVTLRNTGAKPISTQVRVFRWIQESGKERLEPTQDVVASPPAIELRPAQDYVVRVVRLTKNPVAGEEAYRLFIDELPEVRSAPGSGSGLLAQGISPCRISAERPRSSPAPHAASVAPAHWRSPQK